jgi:hypothetical protein
LEVFPLLTRSEARFYPGALARTPRQRRCYHDVPPGEWRNLADAQDSGSCEGNLVGVQLPPRPPNTLVDGPDPDQLVSGSSALITAVSHRRVTNGRDDAYEDQGARRGVRRTVQQVRRSMPRCAMGDARAGHLTSSKLLSLNSRAAGPTTSTAWLSGTRRAISTRGTSTPSRRPAVSGRALRPQAQRPPGRPADTPRAVRPVAPSEEVRAGQGQAPRGGVAEARGPPRGTDREARQRDGRSCPVEDRQTGHAGQDAHPAVDSPQLLGRAEAHRHERRGEGTRGPHARRAARAQRAGQGRANAVNRRGRQARHPHPRPIPDAAARQLRPRSWTADQNKMAI